MPGGGGPRDGAHGVDVGARAVARAPRDAAALRAAPRPAGVPHLPRVGRLPAAARRLLRRLRLAPPRDAARRLLLALRAVLHLRPAGRRPEDAVEAGPGDAHPRPRAAVPCPGGDPPHLVAEVGRVDRVVLVPGGSRGAPQHGRRRVRRHGRRLVGRERAHVGDPARRRHEARRDPRLPPRPLRRRRRGPADEGRRLHRRDRPARRGGRDVQGAHAGVAPGRCVLERREPVRQRLVAGGLRRRPRLRGPGRGRRDPPRRARRLPPPLRPPRASPAAAPPAPRTRSSRARRRRSRTPRGSGAPRSAGRTSASS